MLDAGDDPAVLLIAPTGGGKTLAGFLPTLIELADGRHRGLHTIYVSPLKALATDIRRNLTAPVTEMALPIRIEDRTGDTKQTARKRQRADPPHILLTTPESLALLLSYEDAPAHLRRPAPRHRRRDPRARREQARRAAHAPPLAAPDPAPGSPPRRPLGHGRGPAGHGRPPARPSRPLHHRGRRPRPRSRHRDPARAGPAPLGRRRRALRDPRRARPGAPPRHHADLPQHPRAGRDFLPRALARQRGRPAHRHPPRLPLARAAPARRGRHGRGRAARHRVHCLARPRHRLGRRRPRDPDRRAQERQAPGAADRPRQPPLQRALQGPDRARQPVRGAGMRRRAGRGARARPRRRPATRGRPRRPVPARPPHRRRRSVRGGRPLRGGPPHRRLRPRHPRHVRRLPRLRRHRRLRPARLRPLAAPAGIRARPLAPARPRGRRGASA